MRRKSALKPVYAPWWVLVVSNRCSSTPEALLQHNGDCIVERTAIVRCPSSRANNSTTFSNADHVESAVIVRV